MTTPAHQEPGARRFTAAANFLQRKQLAAFLEELHKLQVRETARLHRRYRTAPASAPRPPAFPTFQCVA